MATNVPTHSFEASFGPLYVGALLSMMLFGISTLQSYFYFRHYPNDTRLLRGFSAFIWILDAVHVALVSHVVYAYVIACFEDAQLGLLENSWSISTSILLNVIIAVFSQCFFAHQIYTLWNPKSKIWVTGVVMAFVIAHFVSGISTVVRFYRLHELGRVQEAAVSSTIFAITAILSDVIIAVALCMVFKKTIKDVMANTSSVIDALIVYAINRCILTSLAATVEVALFRGLPTPFYSFAIDFIIGKLYINSYFAALNSRRSLKRRAARVEPTSIGLSPSLDFASTGSMSATSAPNTSQTHERTGSRGEKKEGESSVTYPPDGSKTKSVIAEVP